MSDLRVTVGGDSTGFQSELAKAKAEAQKFSTQMDAQSQRNLAAANQRVQALQARELAKDKAVSQKGVAAANLAGQVGGFADPKLAAAIMIATSGFFTLKDAALALGVSMKAAALRAGLFAAAAFGAMKIFEFGKENVDLYKAANAERKAMQDEIAVTRRAVAAYDKYIQDLQSRGAISEAGATKLRVGIRSSDFETQRRAFTEVRKYSAGPDRKLQQELAKAVAETIPDARKREITLKRLQFDSEIEELAQKYKTAIEPDQKSIGAIAQAMKQVLLREIAEINAKYDQKGKDAQPKAEKTAARRPETVDGGALAQVGLFTSQFLKLAPLEDIGRKQLEVQRQIARNTKPMRAAANPFT